MTTEPVRAEVVAQFLKENPLYLELGLEVEAGLRHLRDEANKVVTSRLDKEFKELVGWRKKAGCWLFSRQNADWKDRTWSGVWLWRASAEPLNFIVGVEGWPDNDEDIEPALEEAFRHVVASSQHRDAWSAPRQSKNKVEWNFCRGNQFLVDDPEKGVQQIMELVRALVEVAKRGDARTETGG